MMVCCRRLSHTMCGWESTCYFMENANRQWPRHRHHRQQPHTTTIGYDSHIKTYTVNVCTFAETTTKTVMKWRIKKKNSKRNWIKIRSKRCVSVFGDGETSENAWVCDGVCERARHVRDAQLNRKMKKERRKTKKKQWTHDELDARQPHNYTQCNHSFSWNAERCGQARETNVINIKWNSWENIIIYWYRRGKGARLLPLIQYVRSVRMLNVNAMWTKVLWNGERKNSADVSHGSTHWRHNGGRTDEM